MLGNTQPVELRSVDTPECPDCTASRVPQSPATGLTADVQRNRGAMTESRECLAGVLIDADILL
jgi:hypothetical protein